MTHKVAPLPLHYQRPLIPSQFVLQNSPLCTPYSPPIPVHTSSLLTHYHCLQSLPTLHLPHKPCPSSLQSPFKGHQKCQFSRQPPGISPVKSAHVLPLAPASLPCTKDIHEHLIFPHGDLIGCVSTHTPIVAPLPIKRNFNTNKSVICHFCKSA